MKVFHGVSVYELDLEKIKETFRYWTCGTARIPINGYMTRQRCYTRSAICILLTN